MRRIGKVTVRLMVGLLLLLLALAVVSFVVNRNRPIASAMPERLSEIEKARIAEAIQLRTQLGDQLWEGWGSTTIPLIIYNEAYAFLINFPNEPADGLG